MKRESFKLLAAFVLSILLATAFASCGSKDEGQNDESLGAPVKVVSPTTSNMVNYLQLNANTTFLKKEIVRASFQGYVEKAFKNIGDAVSEGDVLFKLQTKESYALNNADEKSAGLKNFSVPIKAKSSGVLTQLNFHSGDYVADGDQIAVIANPKSLVVMLNVPYQKSSEIKIGSSCTLFLPDGRKLNGRISRAIPSVDVSSQTQTYLIDCGELVSLPENLNLTVKIPVRTVNDATVLPKSSVLSNETLSEFWIMKLINDRTAVRVNVSKGIENDSLVQILNPKLNSNDKIVLEGGYGLPDTAKVKIER